jgi:predicted dehydrogenase
MSEPLRIILVGVGRRGGAWVKAFSAVPEWRPVGLVDLDQGFLAAAREATGLPETACFASLGEALQRVEADAVSIVVPARLHAPMIEQALGAGKHVLVEKPFTTSLADAERLVEQAEHRGRVILVTQTARYGRVARTLQRLVAEERYGPLGLMTMTYHKARGEPYPYSEHMHLWGQGVHELDTMCAIAGRPVLSVMGRSVQPAWSTWPSEALAEALLTFGPRPDRPQRDDRVYGTYVGTSDARAPGYSFRLECAGAAIVAARGGGPIQALRGKEAEDLPPDDLGYASTDQHLAQRFHQAITTGEEPETSGRRNLATMRLLDAIIRSGETGQAISLAGRPAGAPAR